jgi:D-aminopeptidase
MLESRMTKRFLPLLLAIFCAGGAAAEPRARLRDLGVKIGRGTPGPLNAITDVAGVRVGQVTVWSGDEKSKPGEGPARTGVTAIVPHGGDIWSQNVPAATWVLNGAGEMTGSIWIDTLGALQVPVLLTNTMNVGSVMDGVVRYMIKTHPKIGLSDDVVAPTVAECDDSTLNDARGLHVSAADAERAIVEASTGPVAEGAVGAGTGMMAYEFKGGIGTASRVLAKEDGGWTVGALVNANMGRRRDLLIDGAPVGREISDLMPKEAAEGSIVIVIATDAPLDPLRLKRLASKAAMGLARTGATARNGSGDLFLAFSTGNKMPHATAEDTYTLKVVAEERLNGLFEAAEEATEEAILNALTAAKTTVGRNGNTAYELPLSRVKKILRKYGR